MWKYVLAAAAAFSLVGTVGWANVQEAAKPGHTGSNFRVVTRTTNPVWTWPIDKEARSAVWTEARSRVQIKGRTVQGGGRRKVPCWREVPSSAVFEGSADDSVGTVAPGGGLTVVPGP